MQTIDAEKFTAELKDMGIVQLMSAIPGVFYGDIRVVQQTNGERETLSCEVIHDEDDDNPMRWTASLYKKNRESEFSETWDSTKTEETFEKWLDRMEKKYYDV